MSSAHPLSASRKCKVKHDEFSPRLCGDSAGGVTPAGGVGAGGRHLGAGMEAETRKEGREKGTAGGTAEGRLYGVGKGQRAGREREAGGLRTDIGG